MYEQQHGTHTLQCASFVARSLCSHITNTGAEDAHDGMAADFP
jgi:hypothetical protein